MQMHRRDSDSKQWMLLSGSMAACLPHGLNLSPLVLLFCLLLFLWRAGFLWGYCRLPTRRLLSWITVAGFVLVLFAGEGFMSRDMGVGLLVLALSVKLLGLDQDKDMLLVLSFGFMVAILAFLHSDSYVTIWLVTFALLLLLYAGSLFFRRDQSSSQKVLLIHCLSVYPHLERNDRGRVGSHGVAFFIVLLQAALLTAVTAPWFPRNNPLPQWDPSLSWDSNWGKPGISDRMQPGTISRLLESNEVALRVRFDKAPPKPVEQLYWRGPVLTLFDGKTWSRDSRETLMPRHGQSSIKDLLQGGDASGRGAYSVELQAHGQRWLYSLDHSQWLQLQGVRRPFYSREGEWLLPRRLIEPMSYRMGYLDPGRQALPDPKLYLQLPSRGAPQARTLAQQLAQGLAPTNKAEQMKQQVLHYFRTQPFFYSKQAPLLSRDPVDEFLFQSRSGYCEHYASAFVFLMRAAGVPARVVTGYYGGEKMGGEKMGGDSMGAQSRDSSDGSDGSDGSYVVVRQSRAHAWAEIWQDGRWQRVDPTTVIPPQRKQDEDALTRPLDQILNQLSEWWYQRTRELAQLLETGLVGVVNKENALRLFWFGLSSVLLWFMFLGLRRISTLQYRNHKPDPCVQAYGHFCRLWESVGLPRQAHESASDYAQRLCKVRPDLSASIYQITQMYNLLRYSARPQEALLRQYRKAIKLFKL